MIAFFFLSISMNSSLVSYALVRFVNSSFGYPMLRLISSNRLSLNQLTDAVHRLFILVRIFHFFFFMRAFISFCVFDKSDTAVNSVAFEATVSKKKKKTIQN